MKPSLRKARFLAVLGGVTLILATFWAPFYFSYLAFAAIIAGACVFVQWLGVRRQRNYNPNVTMLAVVGFLVSRMLLPSEVTHGSFDFCKLQYLGVWAFSLGILQMAFRKQFVGDVESQVA